MTGLSLKLFFRNRIVPLMAVLLAAATVLLSVACCLFYSAKETAESVTGMFQTVPLVAGLKQFATAGTFYDESTGASWVTWEVDDSVYESAVRSFMENPYLSRDDRRTYAGYAPGIQPLRSKAKYIESIGIPGRGYYDITEGKMDWEKQYKKLVLDCTVLEMIQNSTGGDPYSEEYIGPGKPTWLGDPDERPQEIYDLSYVYVCRIDHVLADTETLSALSKLAEQKVYVTFDHEPENPTGLKVGDRCLLYGEGWHASQILENILGEWYSIFPDGQIVADAETYSWTEEEQEKAIGGKEVLQMRLTSNFDSSSEKNDFIRLSGKEALDVSSREAFLQSSGLGAEEGDRWFHIIQNCRESVNGLAVVTTRNSRSILPFASKAAQIIAGRHVLPGDTEPVCIISGELAEAYGLSVGDTLPLRLHRAEVKLGDYYINEMGTQPWYLRTDCEARQEPPEVDYRIVGMYQSMGWNEDAYPNYFSPDTVFVSAAATPVIERSPEQQASWEKRVLMYETYSTLEELETEVILYTPQVLWGYYLTESDQAQAFMDSLPEEVRRNVQLLDEGYEHIQPQLEALREQMKGIVLLTLGAWVLAAALFIFLCLFRGQSAMGTLRSLGAGIGYTFRQWLLLCLCLWLVSAGVGGVLSGVLYDKIEQKVFEAASYGEAYNQAFSDLGSAAEQGYNPYEGTQGHSGESAETVYRQVKDTLHIGRMLPLTILAQGGVFLLLCAVTLACLTRRKVPKLLRHVG